MNKELLEKYIATLKDAEVVDEKNVYVWNSTTPKSKKVVHEYQCDKCGRKKTVRLPFIGGRQCIGPCPRCKEGKMMLQMNKAESEQ